MKRLLLLAAVIAAPAAAQTQMQLNAQAGADYRRADTQLNVRYGAAMADAKRDGPATAQALLASQRAWLAFRDAECRRVAEQYAGGSMQPMQELACKADLTRQRTRQLQAPAR